MFLSGLSESGYLSNALLTELMPASIPIFVHMESISRVTKNESLDHFDKRCLLIFFFTKCSCAFANVYIYSDVLHDSDTQAEIIYRPSGALLFVHVCLFVCLFVCFFFFFFFLCR